jgi:hypothetical protein
MSWSAARPVLVAIVGGVAPTVRKQGLPSKFKHDPNGEESEAIGDSRRYWLSLKQGNAIGHVQPTATRYRFSVDVVVEYVFDVDFSTLDEAIGEDAIEIVRALATSSNWQRPTSTIIAVSPAGDSLGPFVVEDVEGGKRLRMTFDVEITR